MGPKSHFAPSEKPTNTTQGPIFISLHKSGRRGRGSSFGVEKLMLALAPVVKFLLSASVYTVHLQQEQQKPGAHLNGQN